MGSSKHDERAFPYGTDNERSSRKLLATLERLAAEGQDDIAAACYAAMRAGRNPFDVIAEALSLMSRDRLAVRKMAAEVSELSARPMIILPRDLAPDDPARLVVAAERAEVQRLRAVLLQAVCRECYATPQAEDCWTRATTRRTAWVMCNAARRALPLEMLAAAARLEAENQRRRRAADLAAVERSRKAHASELRCERCGGENPTMAAQAGECTRCGGRMV